MNITLENLEQFSVDLDDYKSNWIFMDENDQLASQEHKDQIFVLNNDAAKFLWDFEMKCNLEPTEKYFKKVTTYDSSLSDQTTIRKYLYNLGIPFNQKIFIAMQPDIGFVLTWKMVIKYSHNLFFAYDQVVRDKTFNWMLEFHHDDVFTFARDNIYDSFKEIQLNKEKITTALKKMENRKLQMNSKKNN